MKKLELNPTIYAFGLPVPAFIRWPLMGLAILTIGIIIVVPVIIAIPTVSLLAAGGLGIAFLTLKYYFKIAPSGLKTQNPAYD